MSASYRHLSARSTPERSAAQGAEGATAQHGQERIEIGTYRTHVITLRRPVEAPLQRDQAPFESTSCHSSAASFPARMSNRRISSLLRSS